MTDLLDYTAQTVSFGGRSYDVSRKASETNPVVYGLRETARDFDTVTEMLARELTRLQRQTAEASEHLAAGYGSTMTLSAQTFGTAADRIAELMTRRAAAERQLVMLVDILNEMTEQAAEAGEGN